MNLVHIHNIKYTYLDEDDPWSEILMDTASAIISTKNRLKLYSPVQLLFGRDIILLIKHMVDCELIRKKRRHKLIKITSVKIVK